jgi:hypothetical protein
MDLTIDLDNLIINKDLSGVSLLYKELYDMNNYEDNIIFNSHRAPLCLTLPVK